MVGGGGGVPECSTKGHRVTRFARCREKKKKETHRSSFDVAFFFLIWSLKVMSARLSSWDSRPSVPARAGRGAGIKSSPLHLIRPKTFSEARLEPGRDYLTFRRPHTSPSTPPAVGRQPPPPPPRASLTLLKSKKQRQWQWHTHAK